MWINGEKRRKTYLCPLPCLPCRFSGQTMSFYGKIGTGDIVSYFHKKIKTLKKCKTLENVPFAIFVPQSGFPHLPQSLVSHPVENISLAPPASYALHPEVMPEFSTKIFDLSTCKSGERRETLGALRPQTPDQRSSTSGLHQAKRLVCSLHQVYSAGEGAGDYPLPRGLGPRRPRCNILCAPQEKLLIMSKFSDSGWFAKWHDNLAKQKPCILYLKIKDWLFQYRFLCRGNEK